ncbi:MAG: cytochrome c biogenesis heme-transporting ATPase CcmA [Oceanobacter sp.]
MNANPALSSSADFSSGSVALNAKQLFCERDDRVLFENLDLTISNGDLIQLAGPNGAGKTTLLRLLAGLNRDFEGDLFWHSDDLHDCYSDYAQQRLYHGHLAAIKRMLTPLENLRWLMSLWMSDSVALEQRISEDDLWQALAEVNLNGYEDVPCNQLSAGQQRRVGLARLAIVQVPLWILDEPFTALDVDGVSWLEQRIAGQVARNGAVVITSHHALQGIPGLQRIDLGQLKSAQAGSLS